MHKPANPIRRNVINQVLNWHPAQEWENDPMRNANILIKECQNLLPYVTVIYHNMAESFVVREYDETFHGCLRTCLPILSEKLRVWLLSCPYLQKPEPRIIDEHGNVIINSKIRYGYLGDGGRTPKVTNHFELNSLSGGYPNWFGTKIKAVRVSDIAHFINQWGDPFAAVSQRGKSKEDRYAFVYSNRGI